MRASDHRVSRYPQTYDSFGKPHPARAAERDAYYLRRRVNLVMAALFLAFNLLLLAILLPALVSTTTDIFGTVTLPTPDHR